MRRASAIVMVLAALTLTACSSSPKHATVADCVTWLTKQLAEHGTDPAGMGPDILKKCESNKDTMTEAKFDSIFG